MLDPKTLKLSNKGNNNVNDLGAGFHDTFKVNNHILSIVLRAKESD